MKTPKVWKNGPPDLDWDDKLNALKGLGFLGADVQEHEIVLRFKGRQFTLTGDGQRHSYEVAGAASGAFGGIEVLRCKKLDPCHSEYVARLAAGDDHIDIVAARKTDEPQKEGFRFRMTQQKITRSEKPTGKTLRFKVG